MMMFTLYGKGQDSRLFSKFSEITGNLTPSLQIKSLSKPKTPILNINKLNSKEEILSNANSPKAARLISNQNNFKTERSHLRRTVSYGKPIKIISPIHRKSLDLKITRANKRLTNKTDHLVNVKDQSKGSLTLNQPDKNRLIISKYERIDLSPISQKFENHSDGILDETFQTLLEILKV